MRPPNVQRGIEVAALAFRVLPEEVVSSRRRQPSKARRMVWLMLVSEEKYSQPQLARYFGVTNGSIAHALKKAATEVITCKNTAKQFTNMARKYSHD